MPIRHTRTGPVMKADVVFSRNHIIYAHVVYELPDPKRKERPPQWIRLELTSGDGYNLPYSDELWEMVRDQIP